MGLLDGIIILPLVGLWDVLSIESFEMPPTNRVWTLLLVNGFIGTVLSELLWLWYVLCSYLVYYFVMCIEKVSVGTSLQSCINSCKAFVNIMVK